MCAPEIAYHEQDNKTKRHERRTRTMLREGLAIPQVGNSSKIGYHIIIASLWSICAHFSHSLKRQKRPVFHDCLSRPFFHHRLTQERIDRHDLASLTKFFC